jgi:hypothetical protein
VVGVQPIAYSGVFMEVWKTVIMVIMELELPDMDDMSMPAIESEDDVVAAPVVVVPISSACGAMLCEERSRRNSESF